VGTTQHQRRRILAQLSAATGSAPFSTGLAAYLQRTLNSLPMISQTSFETESRSLWVSFRPLHVPLASLALARSAGGSLLQTQICLNLLIATPTPKHGMCKGKSRS